MNISLPGSDDLPPNIPSNDTSHAPSDCDSADMLVDEPDDENEALSEYF